MKVKKYLPIILFVIGLGVVSAAAFLVLRGRKTDDVEEETALLKNVPLLQRPVAKLTPSEDGHWLKLDVEKFEIEAETLDYELLYKLPDGRTQGVPGTIELEGQDSISRDLLLGSESSGKFRYDEGVEKGTLTLRFRNEKGKLVARFTSEFVLLSGTTTLTSAGGEFAMELAKDPGVFFVVMGTFGVPEEAPGEVVSGPYGVFSSEEVSLAGSVEISNGEIYRWTGTKWTDEIGGDALSTGIFVGVSE
jgi:hypothetical protein